MLESYGFYITKKKVGFVTCMNLLLVKLIDLYVFDLMRKGWFFVWFNAKAEMDVWFCL